MTAINKSNHRYLIFVLFLIITIDTMGIGFVWPLFGPLFTGKDTSLFTSAISMEWRNILYGITIGIASLATFLGAPILGSISDNIGRRKVLLICLVGTSIGMIISALGIIFNQVILLIISRICIGGVAASQVIAQAAIIDISSLKNKATRLGIISAANNIGFIFGPIISVLLIDKTIVSWFNLTTPFYFGALLAISCAFLLLATYKIIEKTKSTTRLKFTKSFSVFKKAITSKNIRVVALTYLCLQIGWALYLQNNFLFLIQNYNYSSKLLGYFLSWLGVVFCFNLLITVRFLTPRISLKKIIYLNLLLAAICCIVSIIYNTETGIWLNILPMATAIALGSNAILTTLSNIAESSEQGWAMGIGSSIAALAWAITPPFAGIILVFGFEFPLILAGVLFLLGTAITIKTKKD